MKNKLFIFGIAGILLYGLILAGCQTTGASTSSTPTETGGPTKFEGTWKHRTTEVDFRYIFTNNNFETTNNGRITRKGTFTFTDSTITFDCGKYGKWTQNYTMAEDGSQWVLENDGSHDRGTFIKQL